MSKIRWKYVFLTLSLAAFAIALCDRDTTIIACLSLPIGTILLGMFLIFNLLENESALFDEQHRQTAEKLAGPPTSQAKRTQPQPIFSHEHLFPHR